MTGTFSDEEIHEFKIEAFELLEQSENCLLNLEKGSDFLTEYAAIFRVFHSLKGGAGMLGLEKLQAHMHQIESFLTQCKSKGSILRSQITFFLAAVDISRKILSNQNVQLKYDFPTSDKIAENTASNQSAPVSHAKPDSKVAIKPESTKPPIIFAVDDEKDILDLLKEILLGSGFDCRTFLDPRELLNELQSTEPDAILTDMNMPHLTGEKVLTEVRRLKPDVPVLYLSGYLSKETLIAAFQLGLYGAIEKPFDTGYVVQQVTNAVRHSKSTKVINSSINLILYQFSDLDDFLKKSGKEDIRNTMRRELDAILEVRRMLRANR